MNTKRKTNNKGLIKIEVSGLKYGFTEPGDTRKLPSKVAVQISKDMLDILDAFSGLSPEQTRQLTVGDIENMATYDQDDFMDELADLVEEIVGEYPTSIMYASWTNSNGSKASRQFFCR